MVKPVDALILPDMPWVMMEGSQPCILFDAVNPLRQFKRGTVFDATMDDAFPARNYRGDPDPDLTESDEDGVCQPYIPDDHRCVFSICSLALNLIYASIIRPRYRFECLVTVDSFLSWTAGQLADIKYGKTRKRPRKDSYTWKLKPARIPVQYARIVHQFILEDSHGSVDTAHESLRRKTYAQRMLDELGFELDAFEGTAAKFRSAVLTPVLQRQLRGVPDAYAPSVQAAIGRYGRPPTIAAVTTFYLGVDPLDPRCIPSYRRNLVYIREASWHLSVVMGATDPKSKRAFRESLISHDAIMEALRAMPGRDERTVPPFTEAEVQMLVSSGVHTFFEKELRRVVSACLLLPSVI